MYVGVISVKENDIISPHQILAQMASKRVQGNTLRGGKEEMTGDVRCLDFSLFIALVQRPRRRAEGHTSSFHWVD